MSNKSFLFAANYGKKGGYAIRPDIGFDMTFEAKLSGSLNGL
ncbi:MAG: hypothetical protein Q4B82_04500 [Alysiella sp.]|nr:hypothetical protein [Alysiella sp.]MDO4433823.1 hypothetical protein [Alysiella sp.]